MHDLIKDSTDSLTNHHHIQHNNPVLNQAKIKNKKLVKNLTNKMFKGYTQIKNSKLFTPITESNDTPTLQWAKQRLMPFNELYNLNYKHKHFKSNQMISLNKVFEISNANQNGSKKTRNNLFLTTKETTNSNSNAYQIGLSPSIEQSLALKDTEAHKAYLLKQLFPYESELDNVSSLQFLSLERRPPMNYHRTHTGTSHPNKTMKTDKQMERKRYKEHEFLYKISHPINHQRINTSVHNNRGKNIKEANDQANNTSEALKLNIVGITDKNKPKVLTPNERRFNYIHDNLEAIRSLPKDTFKEYIDSLFTDNGNDSTDYNKQSNVKELQLNLNEAKERERERRRLLYINKQPQLIKYKVFQSNLNQREDKYNEIRKMAFELKDNTEANKTSYNSRLITTISPSSHLLTESNYSFKTFYDKQAKRRDVNMAWGLRKEFTQNDIRRLLNGKELLDCRLNE